jgi:hypothetical protein
MLKVGVNQVKALYLKKKIVKNDVESEIRKSFTETEPPT